MQISNSIPEGKPQNFILTILGILAAVGAGFVIAKFGTLSLAIVPLLIISVLLGVYLFKNPFFGFLLIIFFLPFERVPTYLLGGVNIKINTILGFVTLFTWLLALIFNGKKWKVQPNVLAIPLSLFTIALILSLTQAVNLDRSIQVLIFILFTIALSIFSVNMIDGINNLKKVIYVIFFSSLVVGLFGLVQFGGDVIGLPRSITLLKEGYTSKIFGFPRIQAFSMEPLYYANYLLIPISLSLAYFLGRVKLIKHWWLIGLLALLLINFVLTVSRGGYIGLLATLAVFVVAYFRRFITWRNLGIVIILVLVYFGVTFALSKSENRAMQQFLGHVTLKDLSRGESIVGRLRAYDVAEGAFLKNPILGIGIGNYGPYVKGYPNQPPKTGWDIVNNQYLELAAEAGLVGIITFGLIFLIIIVRSFFALKVVKDPFIRATLIGLLAALVGILVQYNFFSTLYIIHIWVVIGLLVGVQNLAFKKSENS